MIVHSFEVNDDSDASTPGTEDTSSFVVAQVYRTDEYPSKQLDIIMTLERWLSQNSECFILEIFICRRVGH